MMESTHSSDQQAACLSTDNTNRTGFPLNLDNISQSFFKAEIGSGVGI